MLLWVLSSMDEERQSHRSERERCCIVYVATHASGRTYVGWTAKKLGRRRSRHLVDAKAGSSCYFHRALMKHGIEAFEWTILEAHSTDEEAKIAEIWYIEYFKSIGVELYNMTNGGDGQLGQMRSDITRNKISSAMKGRVFSDEHLERLRTARRERSVAPEVGLKIANALKGRKKPPRSKEHCRRISDALKAFNKRRNEHLSIGG